MLLHSRERNARVVTEGVSALPVISATARAVAVMAEVTKTVHRAKSAMAKASAPVATALAVAALATELGGYNKKT